MELAGRNPGRWPHDDAEADTKQYAATSANQVWSWDITGLHVKESLNDGRVKHVTGI